MVPVTPVQKMSSEQLYLHFSDGTKWKVNLFAKDKDSCIDTRGPFY